MAWYDTGTVSVTNGSTAVTGSGTNFIAGAQVGEGFASSDGRLYEIQAIVSATSLTLADPYLGSTQTGQDYKIVPTQSLVANLASQVSTLISDFQSVADEAGEGKFDDGSAASAGITFTLDQNTGFFRPADNQIGFSTGGVQRALLSSTALTLNVPFSGTTGTFSGNLTAGGDVIFQEKISMSGGSRGSVQIGSPNAVSGISERPVSYGNNLLAINDPSDTTASIWSQPSANIGGAALVMTADNGDFGSFQFFAAQDQDIATSVVERMRITSTGSVGIGTPSPAEPLHVVGTVRSDVSSTGDFNFRATSAGGGQYRIYPDDATTAAPTWLHQSDSSEEQAWVIGGVERMRLDSSGRVGLGTDNPAYALDILGSGDTVLRIRANPVGAGTDDDARLILDAAPGGESRIAFRNNGVEKASIEWFDDGPDLNIATEAGSDGKIDFQPNGSLAMRVTADGDVLVGKAAPDTSVDGVEARNNGTLGASVAGGIALVVNRNTNDGQIVAIRQGGTTEGSISVSGTTVSFNGGHLARWSQTEDNARIDGLVKGTVLTNLDQMAVWGDEQNEQLNCVDVSSVEGDPNVAGVFVNWDNDDEAYTADMNIAMTGDMIIRIAQGTTVQRGDLLMSAGDGTAKPQDDDIIRSKTIAKVTSTHVTCTYEDGSYCVPCVLMAC